MSAWFFEHEGQVHGPFSLDQLDQLLQAGVLAGDTEVWSGDSATVVLLSELLIALASSGRRRSIIPWLIAVALCLCAIGLSSVAERINLLDYAMSKLADQPEVVESMPPIAPLNSESIESSETLSHPSQTEESTSALVHTLRGHRGYVNCVAISQDGSHAVSGGTDRSVQKWDLENGSRIWKNDRFKRDLLAVFYAEAEILAVDRQSICRLSLANGRTLAIQRIELSSRAFFSRDGKYLVTSHANRPGRLHDLATGSVQDFETTPGQVDSVAFTRDSTSIVYGTNVLNVYHRPSQHIRRDVYRQESLVAAIDVAPNGLYVATGCGRVFSTPLELGDCTAEVWEIGSGRSVTKFKGHQQWVSALQYTPDGQLVASAGGGSPDDTLGHNENADTAIYLWNARTGEQHGRFKAHTAAVLCLDISRNGQRLVSGSADGTLRVWDLPAAKRRQQIAAGVSPQTE
jgi:WD40 repeat protein